jgi:phosphoglycolate phosphatase-like HAD superfamily hydrolase
MYELVMERHLNRMDLLIFDFDGVIADTEIISNTVLAEAITALGHPTSVDDSLPSEKQPFANVSHENCKPLLALPTP